MNYVSLREIKEDTLSEILELEVYEDQKNLVASNARSIAQAHFSKEAWFRGIYAGDIPVGFVMLEDDVENVEYFLWRFMIDKNYQGKGYGLKALELVINYVKTRPNAEEFSLCCHLEDNGPQKFYEKTWF